MLNKLFWGAVLFLIVSGVIMIAKYHSETPPSAAKFDDNLVKMNED